MTAVTVCREALTFSPSICSNAEPTCWCGISNRCGGGEVHASRSTVPYRCLGRASRSYALRDYPTAGDDDFSNRIKARNFVLYTRRRQRRAVHRYEWRRVNVASGNDVFGSRLFGRREIMRAIWTAFTQPGHTWLWSVVAHWPHSTCHRWVKAGAYPRDWGGEGPLDVAAGERVVACHSAEHPCGASALRGPHT